MCFQGFETSCSPSFEPLTHGSFTHPQGRCNILLSPPLFFQVPSAFAPLFSPIGFLWCSHASYFNILYLLPPRSVNGVTLKPRFFSSVPHAMPRRPNASSSKRCTPRLVRLLKLVRLRGRWKSRLLRLIPRPPPRLLASSMSIKMPPIPKLLPSSKPLESLLSRSN